MTKQTTETTNSHGGDATAQIGAAVRDTLADDAGVSSAPPEAHQRAAVRRSKLKRPPVFKIRAEVAVWNPVDPCPRTVLMLVEECLGTNRDDMKAQVRDTVKGKLAHFGIDTAKVEIDIEGAEY